MVVDLNKIYILPIPISVRLIIFKKMNELYSRVMPTDHTRQYFTNKNRQQIRVTALNEYDISLKSQ